MKRSYAWRKGKLADITDEGRVLVIRDLKLPSESETVFVNYIGAEDERIRNMYRIRKKGEK